MPKSKPKSKRWWDLISVVLLGGAIISLTSRLNATDWTKSLGIVTTIALFGILTGASIGYSRFKRSISIILSFSYGIFIIGWRLGTDLSEAVIWREKLFSIFGRINEIALQILRDEVIKDPLLFILLMSILLWVVSVYSSFMLIRYGDIWKTIIPLGVVIFTIHSFDPLIISKTWYLALFLFFSLLLITRNYYLQKLDYWKSSRIFIPQLIGFDFIRNAFTVIVILIISAWTLPALAKSLPPAADLLQKARRPWNEFKSNFDNIFGSLRATVGVRSEYYGPSMVLGRGQPQAESVVFEVSLPYDIPRNVPLYWRARTFNEYEDGLISSSKGITNDFDPLEDNFPNPNLRGRWAGTIKFKSKSHISTLFTPPMPTWVSRPSFVIYEDLPDATIDIFTFKSKQTVKPGGVYSTQGSFSSVTIAELRNSSTDYPDWIRENYLQVPDSISDRTKLLAHELASKHDNPYDIVIEITNYLRENIDYSETIPELPVDQEPLDWFLFDLKQGYCNYYASAEVILLRNVGIPARWVVGYARGELTEEGNYSVKYKDSHAWPEVFFPGYGWIEFEPTVSQPFIIRPPGVEDPNSNDDQSPSSINDRERNLRAFDDELQLQRLEDLLNEELGGTPRNQLNTLLFVLVIMVAIAIIALYYIRWRHRPGIMRVPEVIDAEFKRFGINTPSFINGWITRSRLSNPARAYNEINQALKRLKIPPTPELTPQERSHLLSEEVPILSQPVDKVISEYSKEVFRNKTPESEVAMKAGSDIKWISLREVVLRWFSKLQEPEK